MNISRDRAKEIIAKESIASITEEEAKNILAEYWHYDNESDIHSKIRSGELPSLSSKLISLMIASDEPMVTDIQVFEPLLADWKIFKLKYSANEYLEKILSSYGHEFKVEGKIEKAGICPCCNYYSIDPGEDGMWDICPVCFWENGGDGPNHMAIADAQNNFIKLGAIDERRLQFVEKDGTIKYAKNA